MKILISVKFENRKIKIEKVKEKEYLVFLKSLPVQGKANSEAVKIIAKHFKVDEKEVKIISGKKSRKKIVEIKK